jgi:protoporphyrinogen oxidase
MTPPREVAVVGGGMLGMTLALRLHSEGCRVTIFEAAPVAGGLVQSQSIGGFTWDRFYHVILLSDHYLRGLLEELELTHLLRWGITGTGFYVDGRLYSLSNAVEFLRFPPLSLMDKLRLGATLVYASRVRDWKALEGLLSTEWLRRLSGEHTFDRIWFPLLQAKLGENYRIANAVFIWAIIARLYGARRSGLKREMFGYVEGGYSTILRAFQAELEKRGVQFVFGQAITRLTDHGDRVEAQLAGGDTRAFSSAVLTVPCSQVRRICPELSPAEHERLASVVYQGIICASVLLRRPLGGFYVTNITDPSIPFTAVVEMTSLVNRAAFGGGTLVYLPRYVTRDDPYWQLGDDEIRGRFLPALQRMHPAITLDDVQAFQVARVREMLAVPTLHYSERCLPSVRTSLPNVFVVNSSQIVSGTLNVNETVALAEAATPELRAAFAIAPSSRLPAAVTS